MGRKSTDGYGRTWITETTLAILPNYEKGVLSIRGLYYQLISHGFPNSKKHYKRVIAAATQMRRDKLIAYDTFSDFGRYEVGETDSNETFLKSKIVSAKASILSSMTEYHRNKWENQPYFVEVWIEKQALQGVFAPICGKMGVALCPCKGHPSLSFIEKASNRYKRAIANGQKPVILYFGDYDATGVVIDQKIKENLLNDFGVDVELRRVCLTKAQVLYWKLAIAPTKESDSNKANFEANGGLGQVELDAVEPRKLQSITKYAINKYFDKGLHAELLAIESEEREQFQYELSQYVKTL